MQWGNSFGRTQFKCCVFGFRMSLNANQMLSIYYIFQFGISILTLCTAEFKMTMVRKKNEK